MKVKLNGLTMNYTERGVPQGTPVVFIHGFPFSHEMWEPQMKALPNTVRAITYDIRGHGQSDVADGQYSIEFFVDDLIALLDHLVIQRAVLCGFSMGGYVALRTVERHPERCSALVLCDTRSEPDPDEGKIRRAASVRAVKNDGVKAYAESFVKAVFAERSFQSNPESIEMIKKIIQANSPMGISGTLLAMAARTDTSDVLPRINVPTLILVGELDKITPPSASQSMHEKIRNSELFILRNAAHMSNLENTAEFNERLVSFLRKIGQG